jgi:ATPase subunit of ABC transporter with duplicated ATPase domains
MITVNNLAMRFGAKILFKNVSLQFNPGCRYGLVGANGSGKSTFIKILDGEVASEAGEIRLPNQLVIGTLKQDHYLYENEEIISVVLRGKPKLWAALEKKKDLLNQEVFCKQECDLLDRVEKTIESQEGYSAPSEAAKLLEGLGIQGNMHNKPLHQLSGGYKLRVLLAQLLFGKPEILVLDEPTNHLDLFSIKWLEDYLRQFPGTLIVSSHDRHFLNRVCTHMADVDCGTIKIYKGSYDEFIEKKRLEREQKEALLLKHDKRRGEIQGFIDRFGAKASKAKQAQSKARVVEQLVEEMDALDLTPTSRQYPTLRFVPFRSSSETPLLVKEIAKSYGPKKVLEGVSFDLMRGDRLAIVGANGIGKSTLLEILAGHLASDNGSFAWGFATKIAYFPQDHAREVKGKMNLLEWLGEVDCTLTQGQLREILAKVLFSGDAVKQSIETLSGGETARLILAKMMLQNPNILIFDEPTNHLDMEAIEELSQALEQFNETIIFVSHNRHFVARVANRILEISEHGIEDFKCTYEEYVEKKEKDLLSTPTSLRQRYVAEESPSKNEFSYEDQKKLRSLKTQIKKRVEKYERECDQIDKEIKKIETQLAADGYYQTSSHQAQQALLNQKIQLEDLLQQSMEKWEAASLELLD